MHKEPVNDSITERRLVRIIFMEVSQGIVATPMHKVNTINVLL
jgi:hypothetical protein